ncbi:hypothetical protein BZG36_04768 [Bifiguratus adelaidae]|uniref:Fe2OG dioxygenase domain-containing protein n=1 Tax=Bifiguratus adelaidae TaxID=1938954 RepID=A0A261XVR2_9FUNG|nr:hypothetical protein BZG36_04768 [Bifiguratus adelaidae]
MTNTDKESLPTVDISPFLTETGSPKDRAQTVNSLHQACKDVGFFYLVGHGVSEEEMNRSLDLGKQFFHLPEEAKQVLSIGKNDHARGYQRLGENVTMYKRDWHEGLDFYKPIDDSHYLRQHQLPMRGENRWPESIPEFRPTFEAYIEKMKQVGEAVMKAMAIALGMEETFFDGLVNDSFWVARVIGYPKLVSQNGDVGVSCGEHTDYGCLTLLLQDSTMGALQVQTRDGSWINADPIPGAYVVNIGDMVDVWTNGLYTSTLHRVIHKGDNYRISIPFFFEPNFDAVIEPLDTCISQSGGKKKYESVVYGQHLLRKVANNFDVVEK